MAVTVPIPGTIQASGDNMQLKQIKDELVMARSGKTVDIRTNAAEKLANLLRKVDPKEIDDQVMNDLITLLDTPDDSVRGWVAAAIGFLGPRAKSAVPSLLKVLPDADCVQGDLTSAGAIRLALKRLGVKPPPPSRCGSTKK